MQPTEVYASQPFSGEGETSADLPGEMLSFLTQSRQVLDAGLDLSAHKCLISQLKGPEKGPAHFCADEME